MTRSVFVKVYYTTFALERSLQTSRNLHRLRDDAHHRDEHHRHAPAEQHRDLHDDEEIEHHRGVLAEHHRDVQPTCHRDVLAEHHRGVPAEHHRSFVDCIHREVHAQLTKFLISEINTSMTWYQPCVVMYYSELTTLCLGDALTIDGEDCVPLLYLCLNCSLYDVRWAALQFLASVLEGTTDAAAADDDDDDDDMFFQVDVSIHLKNDATDKILAKLMSANCSDLLSCPDLHQVTSDMNNCHELNHCCDLYQVLMDMLLHTETHAECLVMVSLSRTCIHRCLSRCFLVA